MIELMKIIGSDGVVKDILCKDKCGSEPHQKLLSFCSYSLLILMLLKLSHSSWNLCARSNCLNIHEGVEVKG